MVRICFTELQDKLVDMHFYKTEVLIALCKLNLYVYDPITFNQLSKHRTNNIINLHFLQISKVPRFASIDITKKKVRIFQFEENFAKLQQLTTIMLPFEVNSLFEFSPHRLGFFQQ